MTKNQDALNAKLGRQIQTLQKTHAMFGYPEVTDAYVEQLVDIGFDRRAVITARRYGYIF